MSLLFQVAKLWPEPGRVMEAIFTVRPHIVGEAPPTAASAAASSAARHSPGPLAGPVTP